MNCLGIARELHNSPNRENDDAAILRAVLAELSGLKVETRFMTPEEADEEDLGRWDLIVPMCESYPRLKRLAAFGGGPKPAIINPPEAVLSCYRTRMLQAFGENPEIPFPPTALVAVDGAGELESPPFDGSRGFWVKRGDVHNTAGGRDVVFARDLQDVDAVRRDFARREISHLLLQQHVDGDLIKFYGVGPGRWFTWFYHDPETARRLPFAIDALSRSAARAASALGLEIFGGDAISASGGGLFVIDINSWPSFARVRAEAARQIAWLLESKLKREGARREGR